MQPKKMRPNVLIFFALFACCVLGTPNANDGRIKHVILLMMENRPFDHIFGWSPRTQNGLSGNEYNLLNASDPNSQKIYVSKNAPYINYCDPDHSTPATTYKIYGPEVYSRDGNNIVNEVPKMNGFVEYERDVNDHTNPNLQYCGVMDAFPPERLPVINKLAEEFVMFDKFFCSYPGPTWPNRLFSLCGTSGGLTETIPWYQLQPGRLFPQKTIMDQVAEAGGDWKLYYFDTSWEIFIESIAHHPENVQTMDRFYQDAAEGTLPSFAFLDPRSGINMTTGYGCNDMHPDHDVALGEMYYKEVYEALRASPQWNETLLVLTFDEHGGIYDHMAPPMNVPVPDDSVPFPDGKVKFNRLGIRIPTVLISPWLAKGRVQSDPPFSQRPAPNSAYELTSIMASARKLLPIFADKNVSALTKRDAWAATFEHLFTELPSPRTDCPLTLPPAPKPTPPQPPYTGEHDQKLNCLQKHLIKVHRGLALHGDEESRKIPPHITRQGHVSDYLAEMYRNQRQRVQKWKDSKRTASQKVRRLLEGEPAPIADNRPKDNETAYGVLMAPTFGNTGFDTVVAWWWVNGTNTVNSSRFGGNDRVIMTIYTVIGYQTPNATNYCLDGGNMSNGALLTATLCYPSADPQFNNDPSQQWHFRAGDATIRPSSNETLCVTSLAFARPVNSTAPIFFKYFVPFLSVCDGSMGQHFSWQGPAPGDPFPDASQQIRYGDTIDALFVIEL